MANQELSILISAKNMATKAIKDAEKQIASFSKNTAKYMKASADASKQFATSMTVIGASAMYGIGSTVKTFAEFEKTMASAGSVMNETSDEFKELTALALEMGERTSFSASESAMAIEMLAKNGLDASKILDGALLNSMSLAAAGATDLSTAANISTDVMAIWEIQAKNMDKAVNGIAGVMSNSKFDVNDFSLALAQAGGVAGSVGVEFDDFTTSIAAISPSFASGSDAGTSFRTMLTRLIPVSGDAADSMMELGMITKDGQNKFFDAEGGMKSMAEVSDVLNKSLSNLSDQQKSEALSTIFGVDAMRAAATMSKLTNEEFLKLKKTIKNTSAEDIAREKLDNLAGGYEEMTGAMETASIMIGSMFSPAIKDAMIYIGELTRQFSSMLPSAEEFSLWISENQPLLYSIAGAIAGALVPAFVSLGIAVSGIMLTLAPWMALGVLIVKNWEPIKEFLTGLGIDFDLIGQIFTNVKDLFIQNSDKIEDSFDYLVSSALSIFNVLKKFFDEEIMPIFEEILKTAEFWFEVLKDFWKEWGDEITEFVSKIFGIISDIFETFWEIVSNIFKLAMALLRGDWESAWDYIKELFFNFLELIKEIATLFWESLKAIFRIAIEVVITIIKVLWTGLKKIFNAGWEFLKSVVSAGWEGLKSLFKTGISAVSGAFNSMATGLGDKMTSVWDGIKSTIASGINWMIEKINFIVDKANSVTDTVGIPAIPRIPTVAFAKGGIGNFGFGAGVTNGPVTGLAGESGPEAIVPLPDGKSIPVVLNGKSGGGGSNTNIIVNLTVHGSVQTESNLIDAVSQGFSDLLFNQGVRA